MTQQMVQHLFVFVFIVNVCSGGNIDTYRINARVFGGNINEDIVIDNEKGLMTVNVGQVTNVDTDCPSTINMHDFEKGILAMKNIDAGTCMITETSETITETTELLQNITRMNLKHQIKDEKFVSTYLITKEELLNMAGEKIATFCNGYDLFFGRIQRQDVHRFRRRSRPRGQGCHGFCLVCFFRRKAPEEAQQDQQAAVGALN